MQCPDYRAGRLTIVITFDEDDKTGSNTVLTTVVAPDIAHVTSQTPLTHYSLTRSDQLPQQPLPTTALCRVCIDCRRPYLRLAPVVRLNGLVGETLGTLREAQAGLH
jgi:hypothetical protein